jgi:flagellar assembly protein FliH
MSNSSKPSGFRNIPAPQGSKANSAYNRFIPREELGDFASWKPGSLGDGAAGGPGGFKGANAAAAPAAPAEPTPEEWRARVQAARQSGYQDGYRDGLVALEGFKQSFAQQATQQIGALLEAFDQQLDQLDGEVAAAVSATAVALARQVLRAELQTRPELVAQVAAQAVNAVMLSARHITVQVHPLDLPMVAEGAEEALASRGARLLPDATVARGGVLVQSDIGAVDARIAGRWAQAAASLGSELPWEEDGT